jgi:hypothetical protein
MRHDILKGFCAKWSPGAGIASSFGLDLHRLSDVASGVNTSADNFGICAKSLGDILIVLPKGVAIADIAVIHPLFVNNLPTAAAAAAAAHRLPMLRISCALVWSTASSDLLNFVEFALNTTSICLYLL